MAEPSDTRGIDALNPKHDDVVPSSLFDEDTIESPSRDRHLHGSNGAVGSAAPRHIADLFSPSRKTEELLNQLVLSPPGHQSNSMFTRRTEAAPSSPLNSYKLSDDEMWPSSGECSPRVMGEHDEFLRSLGGMEDVAPFSNAPSDSSQQASLMSSSWNTRTTRNSRFRSYSSGGAVGADPGDPVMNANVSTWGFPAQPMAPMHRTTESYYPPHPQNNTNGYGAANFVPLASMGTSFEHHYGYPGVSDNTTPGGGFVSGTPGFTPHSSYRTRSLSSSLPSVSNISPMSSPPTAHANGTPLNASTNGVEHPHGEHPSRTLFVRNINSNVEDDEIKELFEVHGPTRSIYTQCKHRGFIMVSYYDIRHAKSAIKNLQGKLVRRRKLDLHYSIPRNNPTEKDQNQGTLVVFNLDPATSRDELLTIFGSYGEVKEIRETPNKKHHKFIEFYDVRDAEKAMRHLNKTEIRGKKIKIEPSRPGGRRNSTAPSSPEGLEMGMGSPEELLMPPYSYDAPSQFVSNGRFTVNQPPMMVSSGYANFQAQRNLPHTSPSGARRNRSQSSKSTFTSSPPPFPQRVRRVDSEPNGQFSLNVDDILTQRENRTTLMIRNIPNKYTQKMLLAKVDETHKGLYDFFYLPIDFKNKCNVGYAFINLLTSDSVIDFYHRHHSSTWEKFNSEKVCEITFARIQGKDQLIQHFQNSSLMNEDKKCRPIIFHSEGPNAGEQAPFPLGPSATVQRTNSRIRSLSLNDRSP